VIGPGPAQRLGTGIHGGAGGHDIIDHEDTAPLQVLGIPFTHRDRTVQVFDALTPVQPAL
tara:strand:+ start:9797 stop:9976 length:180 start_codon:yes stop_codon:yes gene_type:complete